MALTARMSSTIVADYTKTSDVAQGEQSLNSTQFIQFDNGVGANQANVLFADTRTVASSEDLDLTGTLTDVFGASLVNARIKGIRITASAANAGNVTVGAAASNAWAALLNSTGTITLHPGASFTAMTPTATGWAVTAGTGDLLKVAGTNVTYTIELLGGAS